MSEKCNKTKRHIHPHYFLIIGLLLTVILGTVAYAKYIHANSGTKAAVAYKFYFSSNLLGDKDENYTYAPGTTEISFTIGNHEDDLRYSELPVYYTIAVSGIDQDGNTIDVTDNVKVEIQKADSGESSEPDSSGENSGESATVPSGAITKTDAVSDDQITISGLTSGKSYSVTATGTSIPSDEAGYPGYHKTLSAVFNIPETGPAVYKWVETKSSYVLLTVWTKDYTGAVDITFPKGLLPDNTDAVMRKWTIDDSTYKYTDTVSFGSASAASETAGGSVEEGTQPTENTSATGYNSHVYRFFIDKNTEGTTSFTDENFTVSYTGGIAAAKKPE